MDPVTLMAAVAAAYNGVKKAVALGREVQDIYLQLGKWAEAADQLYGHINRAAARKPGLFDTITFDQSATAEALQMSAARMQLQQMEEEIRHMFIYGELQNLGRKGYSDFVKDRKEIREKRERMLREQARRRAQLAENIFYSVIIGTLLSLLFYMLWVIWTLGRNRGHW